MESLRVKSMAVLMIMVISIWIPSTVAQDRHICEKNGGRCIARKIITNNCIRLPYNCGLKSICCRGMKFKRKLKTKQRKKIKSNKSKADKIKVRQQCSTRRKCSREGGTCIGTTNTTCGTIDVKELCKGESCTCCLGDKQSCGSSPGCKFRGGICINRRKKRVCEGGTINKSLCNSKSCACCLIKRKCECGQANDQRIVGGKEVSPQNKYPWHVGLKIFDFKTSLCGASIINDLYVITAVHCLFNPTTSEMLSTENIKISVADHNQNSTDEDVFEVTRLVEVQELIFPPNYVVFGIHDDIALLKLKDRLDLSSNDEIKPVCLPIDKRKTYKREEGTLIGWGYLDYDSSKSSNVLMEVKVPILNPRCNRQFPEDVVITNKMICAGTKKGGKDSCTGDSGGSLTVTENGRYTLVGITSFGYGCGEPNIPGVYTRVTKYLDWIKENTADANYCS